MCIAIAKMRDTAFPSDEILHNCFVNNDDGAGFAYPTEDGVRIEKGFMSWNDFKAAIDNLKKKIDVNKTPMLIHFRIATHGARDQSMTHPFPIQYDDGALKKIEYVSDYAVVHNGIISMCSGARTTTGLSDTATFIKEYLTLLSTNKGWNRNKNIMEMIYKMIGSKMAILDKSGFINMTAGFEEFEGNYYSNNSYKENRYRWSNTTPTYSPKSSIESLFVGTDDDDDSYTSSNFTSKHKDNDLFNFGLFDTDYNDETVGLMSFYIGDTVVADGVEYSISSYEDVETIFMDRKRNLWERIYEDVTDNSTGEVIGLTIGYSLIGENAHAFNYNGVEKAWSKSIDAEADLFIE